MKVSGVSHVEEDEFMNSMDSASLHHNLQSDKIRDHSYELIESINVIVLRLVGILVDTQFALHV